MTRRDTFTPDERDVLLALIVEHKSIFSNSSLRIMANTAKKDSWKKVTESFNREPRSSGVQRTEAQLRDFLKRLKTQARKLATDFKKQQNATGGGEAPTELPQWVTVVETIFPNLTIEIHNRFDSDSTTSTATCVPTNLQPENSKLYINIVCRFLFKLLFVSWLIRSMFFFRRKCNSYLQHIIKFYLECISFR